MLEGVGRVLSELSIDEIIPNLQGFLESTLLRVSNSSQVIKARETNVAVMNAAVMLSADLDALSGCVRYLEYSVCPDG